MAVWRCDPDSAQCAPARHAHALLSQVAGKAFAEMPMDDLMSVMPECAKALERGDLHREVVLDGLRTGVMRSFQDSSIDTLPDAVHVQWNEAQAFVEHLLILCKYEVFQGLVTDMSPYAARQVFNVVKLTPLEQLPDSIRRAKQMIQPWPAASFQFTAALRAWLPTRLQQLIARLAGSSEAQPLSPPPTGSRKGVQPAWQRTVWWLDILRTAAVVGVLENSQLVEFCSGLAPRFVEDGIKTATAQAVLSEMGRDKTVHGLGDLFSARLLAGELSRRPAMVRFMPNLQILLFNCPGDDSSAMESIVLSSVCPTSPAHSVRSGTTGDSSATGNRRR